MTPMFPAPRPARHLVLRAFGQKFGKESKASWNLVVSCLR
ncbi:hypothetical protein F750_3989 [Streptomyces sp. PAMC 26508]|nr:hypothetical protein F750_3989 [Streptomyces sp. PAMC 26508]